MKTKILDKSHSKDLNNLYRPTSKYSLETFDSVELKNCFNQNNSKFIPIVLKEWFALLKANATLKISYNSKLSGIKPLDLEKTLWWLFEKKYKILSHDLHRDSAILTLKKESSVLDKKDQGIDHWSFGMVTNGVRADFIKKSIESIRRLNIPNYEIIICGTYNGEKGKDIKYIEFKERDDKGWITRKKNLIARNALYSNLCIFHDRIIFNKDWYVGMKKYGDNFEVISCVQKLSDGTRTGDWITTNVSDLDPGYMYKIEELDYKDWDKYAYIAGQLIMLKKHVWEKASWNETYFWQEGEDIEYSLRLTRLGFLPRFNPFSSCTTLSWRFGRLPRKHFKDMPIRRTIRLIAYYFIKIPKADLVIRFLYPLIAKNKFYSMIKEH